MKTFTRLAALSTLLLCIVATADTNYQPFVLASVSDASLEAQTQATIDSLTGAGFSLAGQYSPVDGANVLVVTSPALLEAAAVSAKGGYGAGERISVATRDGRTEVAFVNPLYIQHAYRMDSDLQEIYDLLSATLGNEMSFGSEKGLTAKKLAKYHYKPLMPYFDEPMKLGSFNSHAAAVAAVEAGLGVDGDALTLVYRIDIPGKDQTVFGVGMKATSDADEEVDIDQAHQLDIVDFEGHSKVAYFPYEILVDGSEVEALPMKFRMVVHFPDLSMMGAHGFMSLRASPGAIEDALEAMLQNAQ